MSQTSSAIDEGIDLDIVPAPAPAAAAPPPPPAAKPARPAAAAVNGNDKEEKQEPRAPAKGSGGAPAIGNGVNALKPKPKPAVMGAAWLFCDYAKLMADKTQTVVFGGRCVFCSDTIDGGVCTTGMAPLFCHGSLTAPSENPKSPWIVMHLGCCLGSPVVQACLSTMQEKKVLPMKLIGLSFNCIQELFNDSVGMRDCVHCDNDRPTLWCEAEDCKKRAHWCCAAAKKWMTYTIWIGAHIPAIDVLVCDTCDKSNAGDIRGVLTDGARLRAKQAHCDSYGVTRNVMREDGAIFSLRYLCWYRMARPKVYDVKTHPQHERTPVSELFERSKHLDTGMDNKHVTPAGEASTPAAAAPVAPAPKKQKAKPAAAAAAASVATVGPGHSGESKSASMPAPAAGSGGGADPAPARPAKAAAAVAEAGGSRKRKATESADESRASKKAKCSRCGWCLRETPLPVKESLFSIYRVCWDCRASMLYCNSCKIDDESCKACGNKHPDAECAFCEGELDDLPGTGLHEQCSICGVTKQKCKDCKETSSVCHTCRKEQQRKKSKEARPAAEKPDKKEKAKAVPVPVSKPPPHPSGPERGCEKRNCPVRSNQLAHPPGRKGRDKLYCPDCISKIGSPCCGDPTGSCKLDIGFDFCVGSKKFPGCKKAYCGKAHRGAKSLTCCACMPKEAAEGKKKKKAKVTEEEAEPEADGAEEQPPALESGSDKDEAPAPKKKTKKQSHGDLLEARLAKQKDLSKVADKPDGTESDSD